MIGNLVDAGELDAVRDLGCQSVEQRAENVGQRAHECRDQHLAGVQAGDVGGAVQPDDRLSGARRSPDAARPAETSADQARLLRLVAASDGAQPSQIERGLNLPPDLGVDSDTLLPALALAARAGRPLAPFKQISEKVLGTDAKQVLTAFSLLQANADHAKVEEAIRGLDPILRGHVYVAAAILRGRACPTDWRMASRLLLFATERPFLL